MVRVVFRLDVAETAQESFGRAWRAAMAAIQGTAEGARGAILLRSEKDPRQLVVVTRWESAGAWRAFWEAGPEEPEGDPRRNEVLIEVDEIEAEPRMER